MDMDWIGKAKDLGGPAPRGIIHVGGHTGQEYDYYRRNGVLDQIWIEPQPCCFQRMVNHLPKDPGIRCFQVACGNMNGTAEMIELSGNDGMSNSLLPPKRHLVYYPTLVPTKTLRVPVRKLDDFLLENKIDASLYDSLSIDVQGYELEVMKGGERTLAHPHMRYVYAEVNVEELYEKCALVTEVDEWLSGIGFSREASDIWGPYGSFGDALYFKREPLF